MLISKEIGIGAFLKYSIRNSCKTGFRFIFAAHFKAVCKLLLRYFQVRVPSTWLKK